MLGVAEDYPGSPSVASHMPHLKMVSWFDERKPEGSFIIDWSISGDPAVRTAFRQFLLEQVGSRREGWWKRRVVE